MLRRSPIFLAVDPNLVSSGLQEDMHSLHKKLWETAENVTFFAGRVKRRIPSGLAVDFGSSPIRGISQQRNTDGVRWLWAAEGGDVWRWYGPGPEAVITAATWQEDATLTAEPTYWDFTHYGNWTIINSSTGAAQIHKPPAAAATYTDAPTDVTRFMKKLSYVMAIGYGARGTQIGWSDSSNIEIFTAAADNNAGALAIDDFDTRIKAATSLGQSIAVYGEDQLALVNFINAPFYFGQKMGLDGIGAVGKAAVASDGKHNVGVGRNGVWWTDGLSYRYLDEGYLHDYLQDNVNWAQKGKIQAVRNDYTGCYEFMFPMGDSLVNNEGWSIDPRTGGWSKIPAFAMKDERKLFEYVLNGLDDGTVHFDQYTPATAAALSLQSRPLLMMVQTAEGWTDAHTDARIDEVEILVKEASNIEFRLHCAQEVDGDYEASVWMPCTTAAQTHKMPAMPSGVYWKIEFRSTAANWTLDLQGFIFYGIVEGSKRTNI